MEKIQALALHSRRGGTGRDFACAVCSNDETILIASKCLLVSVKTITGS